METLETSETLVEDTVMSKLDQEQNPCSETLVGVPGFGDQALDSRNFPEGVEGQIVVGGVVGVIGRGEDCCNLVGTETASLVNDNVAVRNQGGECLLGPESLGKIAEEADSGRNVTEPPNYGGETALGTLSFSRVLDSGNFRKGVEGQIVVGGAVGVIGSGEDCCNLVETETATSVNDNVADGNQGKECSLELESVEKIAEEADSGSKLTESPDYGGKTVEATLSFTRVLDSGNLPEGVEGQIVVGGAVGVIGSGEDCCNLLETETGTSVNDNVADGNQGKECSLELESVGKIAEEADSGSKTTESPDYGGKTVEATLSFTRVLDSGNFLEVVEGQNVVGGALGVIGNGEDCCNLVGTETAVLVNNNVADGNQGEECSLEPESVEKILEEADPESKITESPDYGGKTVEAPYTNKMLNGDGFVQEVRSTDKGIEEVEVKDMLMQEDIEEGDASQLDVVDSSNKIDSSPAGISLYVDVFGPVNSIVQGGGSGLMGEGLSESHSSQEYLWKENSSILHLNGNRGSISEVQDCGIDKDAEEGNDAEGEVVACQENRFDIGDMVWAKLNTQFWWPGVVCKHSDASKHAAKMEKKDRLQIKLFGSGDVLWGWPSQLKPFHENFKQMSTQSNSGGFHWSVEKAVDEIGRRAKLEMTCSCYLEESRNSGVDDHGAKLSKEKASKLDKLAVVQFEPENLLARIKCFARDVDVPSIIEFKVIQSRVSAFYRSIGHKQMSIHQLKPTTGAKSNDQNRVESGVTASNWGLKSRNRSSKKVTEDGDDKGVCTIKTKTSRHITSTKSTENKVKSTEYVDCRTDRKAEKSYESRERRKSKYLSFPYVDPSQVTNSTANLEENEMKDPVADSRMEEDKKMTDSSMGSTHKVKSRDKKSKKSWYREHSGNNKSIQDAIHASSAEMLSKLQFTALDCMYPDENGRFDVWESFFSRFRSFAFRDFTHEDTIQKDFDNETSLPKTLLEVEIQTEKLIQNEESEHWSTQAPAAAPDVSKTAGIGSTRNDINIKSAQQRKKEKASLLGCQFTDSMSENSAIVIGLQKIDPHESRSQIVPKKRKRNASKTPGCPEIKVIGALPDLNGRGNLPQLEGFSVKGAVTPNKEKSKSKRKKEATSANHSIAHGVDENGSVGKVEGLKEVEVLGPYSIQNIPELNKEAIKESATLLLNTKLAPKQPDLSKDAEPSSIMKLEVNKRKRNQKDTPVTSAIPDLNGNTLESHLKETQLPEMKCISAEGEPQKRRRKKTKRNRNQKDTHVTSAIPDLNGSTLESHLKETQLPEMKCISAEGEPQKRRRRKKTDVGWLDINLSSGDALTNGEALGIALLLRFAPEAPMPKKEDLNTTFCKFGPLKDSETQVVNDSGTAQVVFANSSDARNAFRSLEKNSPFGPALVNYRLHVLLADAGVSEPDGMLKLHQAWAAESVKSPRKPRKSKKPKPPAKSPIVSPQQGEGREAPDLQFVRQNLQMMTSMLENAGDNISSETRAQLELEIKSLLKKVSSMVGASSS